MHGYGRKQRAATRVRGSNARIIRRWSTDTRVSGLCGAGLLRLAQPAEQACSGRVQPTGIPTLKARCQVLGQGFAKLHTPLVKAVDAPDDTGNEDAVFVHGEQGAECGGGEFVEDDGGAGAVAGKVLVAGELVAAGLAADHEGARLRQGVGHEGFVVAVEVMGGLLDHDEFGGHIAGALVQPLEEGVLAVAAFFTPGEAGGVVAEGLAVDVHAFAVAFHFQLLQVGGQTAQAVVVGCHAAAGLAEEGAVPDIQQPKPDGQVGVPGLFGKVLVHGGTATDKFQKAIRADGDGNRQTYGRPDREAASHAFGHGQDGVDAKFGSQFRAGGDGDKMLVDVHAAVTLEPLQGRFGVAQGFVRAPGFGDDDEEGVLWLQALEFFLQVVAVQVGDDAYFLMAAAPGGEGLQSQVRTQARAADADVDDVGDVLTGADMCSQVEQLLHGWKNLMLAGHAPVGMVGRAVFCGIDDLAVQKVLAGYTKVTAVGQGLQRMHYWQVPQLLGQVDADTAVP